MCFEASDGCGSRRVGCVVYSLFSHGPWGSVFHISSALQEVAHEGTRHGYEAQTEPFVLTDRSLTTRPIPPYLCTMVVGCHGRPATHQAGILLPCSERTQLECTLTHCVRLLLLPSQDTRTCHGKHEATRSGKSMSNHTILSIQISSSSYEAPMVGDSSTPTPFSTIDPTKSFDQTNMPTQKHGL